MGSYNEVIEGRGRNKAEAFREAWDEYVHENGHRCSLRGGLNQAKAKFIKRIPPDKPKRERRHGIEYIWSAPDPTAPEHEWLEVWEFEVWVHS